MTWSTEWVLLVASRSGAVYTLLGTGTVVGPNRVLTARHVVFENGQPVTDLVVRAKPVTDLVVRAERGDWSPPATIAWSGSDTLDVAVLEVELEGMAPSHPLARLSDGDITSGREWEAHGYPKVRDSEPSTRRESVRGKTCSHQKGHDLLNLDVSARPDKFNGLSGGAVVVEGRIVGVVRAVPTGWGNGRLDATPVASFLREPGFRRALGLTSEDERHEIRVDRIIDQVAATLEKRLHVVTVLAQQLKVSAAPDKIARVVATELVRERKAKETAMALNHLDNKLEKGNADIEDRRAVRTILWQILPVAVDWRQLVVMGWATFTGELKPIELPLRTETLAEIVLAGINEQCCKFAPLASAGMPVGAALVRLPAAAQTALFDVDGSRLAQLIVQQLASEMDIGAQYTSYLDRRDAVEGTLRYHALEAPEDELLPYYFLFRDPDLGGKEPEHNLWALARTEIGKELPSLRLVRLTGGSVADETVLAKHIEAIMRRMP